MKFGYIPVPSRQVYFYHPAEEHRLNSKTRWILKRDDQFLDRSGYQVTDQLSEEDLPRLVELYNMLYLHK
jgi:hypothetical protein